MKHEKETFWEEEMIVRSELVECCRREEQESDGNVFREKFSDSVPHGVILRHDPERVTSQSSPVWISPYPGRNSLKSIIIPKKSSYPRRESQTGPLTSCLV